MDGLPSPRERPPPAPYPSPPSASAATTRGLGAHDPSKPSAYRSLSSSMRRVTHSSVEPARGDFATQVSASAYFDVPSHPKHASVAPARLTRSCHAQRPTIGSYDAWSGVYGDHLGVGKSAVRLSAIPVLSRVLPEDASRSHATYAKRAHEPKRHHHTDPPELDVNTANVLAKQQAQLLELHAQVESLKAALTRSRGRAAGDFASAPFLGTSNGRGSTPGGSARSSTEWRVDSTQRHDGYDGAISHRNPTKPSAVDATTNTLWTPDVERRILRSHQSTAASNSTEQVSTSDLENLNWSYEGGGRKSRGNMTDGGGYTGIGVTSSTAASGHSSYSPFKASAADPLRQSSRSGLRVIRRSIVGFPKPGDDRANPATRLSPAKAEDVVQDGKGYDKGTSLSSAKNQMQMPPLLVPSRPEMRALRNRELVTGDATHAEPPLYAPPSTAQELIPGDIKSTGSAPGLSGSEFGTASTGVRRLIPSRNSAFTPVGNESSNAQIAQSVPTTSANTNTEGDPLRFDLDDPETRWRAAGAAAMIASEFQHTPRASLTLGSGDAVRVSREWGVGASGDSDEPRFHCANDSDKHLNSVFGEHAHTRAREENKMRVVAPVRSFQRVPLFTEGDGSPVSPGRDDDDDSTSEVLRVSRDTFAELSLRGGLAGDDGGDSDDSYDVDDDATDAGTAVTGTTTGRGASEWALPTRWTATQNMSEAVCWEENEDGESEDFDLRQGEGFDNAYYVSSHTSRAEEKYGREGSPLGRSPLGSPTIVGDEPKGGTEPNNQNGWTKDSTEGVPTILYHPMSDDESSDDEEMRAIYAKYNIGATH